MPRYKELYIQFSELNLPMAFYTMHCQEPVMAGDMYSRQRGGLFEFKKEI